MRALAWNETVVNTTRLDVLYSGSVHAFHKYWDSNKRAEGTRLVSGGWV